nr:MAG TPA: hypothetical protein [Bacteriophage sp.]
MNNSIYNMNIVFKTGIAQIIGIVFDSKSYIIKLINKPNNRLAMYVIIIIPTIIMNCYLIYHF